MRRAIQLGMIVVLAAAMYGQTAVPPDGPREKALLLERQGKDAEAGEAWRAILKTHPSDPEPYAHLGLLEARQEHYMEAAADYRQALAIGPSLPALRLNLGLALFKAGEMKDALLEFKPLLKSAPPSSLDRQRLTILIGMCYYGIEEYAVAAPYLKGAVAGDPQNLELRLALAHSCLWSKQYQCVLDTYHEILMLNAESAEADMLAGEALDEMKDTPGAIAQFRAAAKADPTMPDVHFGLGYLLWTKLRYEEALPAFEAEVANNPNHVQALAYLGDTEMRLRHPEAAVPLFEKAIEIDPGLELAHLDLGIIYAETGRNDDALREMKAAERLAPDAVDVHWRLGRLYRAMGDKDASKAELDKAKSITETTDTDLVNKICRHSAVTQTPPTAPAGK